MYSLPQEIEVWYIIPAIRKELAIALTTKHKLSFEKAGEILGVSKAAVSQYLSKKRANRIKIPGAIRKEIEKSAEIIVKDHGKVIDEIQRLVTLMRVKKSYCSTCKKYNPLILKFCHHEKC